jgi:hypothetical protein
MVNFEVYFNVGEVDETIRFVSCSTGNHSVKREPTHLVTLTIPKHAHRTIRVFDVQVAFSNMDPLIFQCVSSDQISVHCTDGNFNNVAFVLEAEYE